MKTLKEIGLEIPGHSKCEDTTLEDYLPIYDKYWTPIRNNDIKLLEIGIGKKGSLRMWKEYFPNGTIYGADIDSEKLFSEDRISTFLVNQEDEQSLQQLGTKIGPLDIIIDDGGHVMSQQIKSIITLFPYVKPKGLYIIEDLCTSYWRHFGGEWPPSTILTTMVFMQQITHSVNSIFISIENYGQNIGTRQVPQFVINEIQSVHFYQGVIIVEKK